MATFTALYFVTRAFRLLNVNNATEAPEPEDALEGFDVLNDWASQLGNERAAIFSVGENVFNLSSGVQNYTIGSGATFNVPRPNWIEGVSVTPDKTSTPLLKLPIGRPLTLNKWRGFIARASTAIYPTATYYDHGFAAATGYGIVSVYPVPTSSNAQLILYLPNALTQFATQQTAYLFPAGWPRMIRYNLACEIADAYGLPVPPRVERIAKESLAWVKRTNFRCRDASFDPSWGLGRGRAPNVVTDES